MNLGLLHPAVAWKYNAVSGEVAFKGGKRFYGIESDVLIDVDFYLVLQ